MSDYSKLKNTWKTKNQKYSLNCKNSYIEEYAPPVTMSLRKWRNYVADGKNTLYGDAIIPSGTIQSGFGRGGSVYAGHVRQGYQGMYQGW
jgi:hypothetical protein